MKGIWPEPEPWRLDRVEACGCRVDMLLRQMRKPCPVHEGDGHLSVLSEDGGGDGSWVVRCLRRDCPWRSTHWTEAWAVTAAQEHWTETRKSAGA